MAIRIMVVCDIRAGAVDTPGRIVITDEHDVVITEISFADAIARAGL